MKNSEWIKEIVKKLTTDPAKNYTYLALFFLIFAVFIIFAIRPSLKTAVTLKKEEVSLASLDQEYEKTIAKILELQQNLEQMRDRLPLLSQAVPERPNVNKLIADIESVGAENTVSLNEVSVGEVNLFERGSRRIKILPLTMKISGSFPNVLKFINELYAQRRIKLADTITFLHGDDSEATQSGSLGVSIVIEGYHL